MLECNSVVDVVELIYSHAFPELDAEMNFKSWQARYYYLVKPMLIGNTNLKITN